MIYDEDPFRRRPRKLTARRKRHGRCVWMPENMDKWASGNRNIAKSGHRVAAEIIPFPRRWHGSMISANLEAIWGMSGKSRLFTGARRGARSRPSSSLLWNGSIGSTTGGSWSPSETSRRPKPRNATTQCSSSQTWRRDSNTMASAKPGAVQLAIQTVNDSALRNLGL